jgi:hypothetical protein
MRRNTAQYREAAREAEKRLRWLRAGRLYSLAVAVYPPHVPGAALYVKDKAQLARNAQNARAFAKVDAEEQEI